MELTVIERNGWKKPCKFEKAVVRIGSATANDIQLSSAEIIPIHLQIMSAPDTPASCKVLNFGPAVQLMSGDKESVIESYATMDLRDGDELVLGEYRLLFHLPLSSGLMLSSRQIAASLSMGDAVLRPNLPATGFLRLRNLGTYPNCQFQVAVNGLSEECFQIDPLPTLYPGAEEDVRIQFFHRLVTPPAGYQTITVSVTAPTSYPGEQVILQQGLYVSPLLKMGINLKDDLPVSQTASRPVSHPTPEENARLPKSAIDTPQPASPAAEAGKLKTIPATEEVTPISKTDTPPQPPLPEEEAKLPEPAPDTPLPESPTADANELQAVPAPEVFAPAIPVQRNLSTTKVARKPSETYWDEGS